MSPAARYSRRRRDVARRKGMCTVCAIRKPTDDNKTCDECIARARRREQAAQRPYCVRCLTFHPPKMHRIEWPVLRRTA
jgi:hypothetical protein